MKYLYTISICLILSLFMNIGNVSAQLNPAGEGDDSSSVTSNNNSTALKDGLQDFGSAGSGLNTESTLIGYIANIIRWILGILGTVFFINIVIQGYIYMTAGGDSGKTATATGAIGNAVVGLLIIMGAFLITNFVTTGLIRSGGNAGSSIQQVIIQDNK